MSQRAALISLVINLYFLCLCIIFGDLRFAAIDDIFMSGILSGIYGNGYNVHLTFVNSLYGYCLYPLYYIFPKINWYYIGEMTSVFISLTVIGYIVVNKVGEKWGTILTTIIVALCVDDFYLAVQFTQCASVLSAAGMLAFIYGLEKKVGESQSKSWLFALCVGILLLWWGSWMRWPAFMMGMPFFACALLLNVKRFWKIKLTVILSLLVIFIGARGFQEFDRCQYLSSDYKKYMEFQGPRSLLGDGQFYNQQAVDEDLDEIAYSGKKMAMLTNWLFYDKEVFAPESIRVITDLIAKYRDEVSMRSQPAKILASLPESARKPIFVVWLLLGLLLMFSNPSRSVWIWVSLTVVCGLMAYLLYLQRLVYRVESGLWLYAAVLTIPFLKERWRIPKNVSMGIALGIALFTLCSYAISGPQVRSPNTGDVVPLQPEKADTKDYKGFLTFMDSLPDSSVFVMSMNSYMSLSRQKQPPYLAEPQGSWERIVSFGFWTPYFPDVEKALYKRGVTNPMKDVVLDNVFVVDEPSLVDFLEQYHYDKVQIDTVRNFNGLVVYKYFLANDSLMEGK